MTDLYYLFKRKETNGYINTYDVQVLTEYEYNSLKNQGYESLKSDVQKSSGKFMIFKNLEPIVTIETEVKITEK